MTERFALYFAPPVTSPLWQRAAEWLGRDPAGGAVPATSIGGLDSDERASLAASACRYGFHATLKAPMALAPGRTAEALKAALADFAAHEAPVDIGPLQLSDLDGFLALTPVEQSPALTAFVARIVEAFDGFRAPLDPRDREKRLKAGLSPRQAELLDVYGYPYVLEEFRFHMTLTDRLAADRRAAVRAAAADWFAPVLGGPVALDRLVLYHEAAPGADFTRGNDYLLKTETDA